MRSLTDQLVSNLLPLLDAEDEMVCSRLDPDLCEALKTDHRKLRSFTEKLAMLSESVERSHHRAPEAKPVDRALHEAMTALEAFELHQRAAFCRLDEILSLLDQEQLACALQAAAAEARERTLLIVQPSVPPRASTVLRKRPDLDTAYAISLAEVDRRSLRISDDNQGH